MTYYSTLLFLHIAFAIVWLGAGILFHILGYRADSQANEVAMRQVIDDLVALANTLFIPSSLLVLVFGILLTIDGPWGFGQLWIVLGLLGFAATFLTGLLWIKPQSERIKETIERDGGMSPLAYALSRRMMVFARLDYVVLMLIVFDMSVKPTGDDVGALVLMAVVFVAGAGFFLMRARSVAIPQPPAAREPA